MSPEFVFTLVADNVLFFGLIAMAAMSLGGTLVAGIRQRHSNWGKPAAILAGFLLACLTCFAGLVIFLAASSHAGAPM